ncbi:MAG: type II toxin-antitoxin system PemK/MazF family toxin [Rhodoglobus sp.]
MVSRGDIRWAYLGEPQGSAPALRRPVLVVQSDDFNRSRIGTVVVVALTSRTQLAELPGNVFVPASASGLTKDSVANVSQVITLDRSDLTDVAGQLPTYLVREVDLGLRQVLGL